MPRAVIAPGEFYHVYNRGVNKQAICLRQFDYARLLFCLLFMQSSLSLSDISETVHDYMKTGKFRIKPRVINKILDQRTVELNSFAIMPNHFHILIYERKEGGISRYLQRIENSYTKYFNLKNKRSGYLFQGPFQSVHISSDRQLSYITAYIHRNPSELENWNGKETKFPWSSYQDYVTQNRWGKLLITDNILGQFKTKNDYKIYVDTSGAKESLN